ncbi:MAG: hypothetical protein ACXWXD_10605, partial [Candidatus Deferrimicrobiaceae bacterium]
MGNEAGADAAALECQGICETLHWDSLYNGEIPGGKDRPVTHHAPITPPQAGGASIPAPILVACALTLVLYLGAYMR